MEQNLRHWITIVEATDPTIIKDPAFRSWFAGSRVTTARGEPKVVFRGLVGDHDPIGGELVWFSESAEVASEFAGVYPAYDAALQPDGIWHGGRVLPAYLRVLNPFIDEHGDWSAVENRISEIRAKGHDGILTNEGGADTWIVFDRTQVHPLLGVKPG